MSESIPEAFDATGLIPGFSEPELPREQPDRAAVDAADHATRH